MATMKLNRFDIRKVRGYPFAAGAEARREYGYGGAHPLIRPYFESPLPVTYYYWKKLELLCALDRYEPDSVAADIGCGPGIFTPTLAGFFRRVIAIDINPGDIVIARKICASLGLNNVSYALGDIMSLPLRGESVDVMFFVDVFEHIEAIKASMGAIDAALKRGGSIVVSAPTENRFNDLSRLAMGYKKPESHYHSSRDLERWLGSRFELVRKTCPFMMPRSLSPVEVFLFRKRT